MKLLQSKLFVDSQVTELQNIIDDFGLSPKLAIIVAKGYSKASERYVRNKHKLAEKIGVEIVTHEVEWEGLESEEFENNLKILIDKLNNDDTIHGIIVQLPVPYISDDLISTLIVPHKDVDGFHPYNLGELVRGNQFFTSCTPKAIYELMNYNKIDVCGKKVCIINRSNIVGKPLANLLINKDATVTVCHSKTSKQDLDMFIRQSDIVITGVGIQNFLCNDNFSDNTIIIDVSINFDEHGKLCGDVKKEDYDKLVSRGCTITPVPGGVGPLTVLSLMKNTIKASFILK